MLEIASDGFGLLLTAHAHGCFLIAPDCFRRWARLPLIASDRFCSLLAASGCFRRWNQFDRKQAPGLRQVLQTSNVSITAPPVPQSAACAHQYSINVPGFGYSSRLRALLRCGGAVVHVTHPSSEFFMPLLRHKEHLYLLSGREPVREDLLPLLTTLQADPAQAGAVAAAGRAFAVHWLSFGSVLEYLRTLLVSYSALYERGRRASGAPALTAEAAVAAGFVRIDSVDELPRLAGLCHCPPRRGAQQQQQQNGGGAIVGTMLSVTTADGMADESHRRACARTPAAGSPTVQLRELARCRLWAPPGGERCFDARCCVGWDCGTRPLGCGHERRQ